MVFLPAFPFLSPLYSGKLSVLGRSFNSSHISYCKKVYLATSAVTYSGIFLLLDILVLSGFIIFN